MTIIHRREMLKVLLGGAAAATAGLALLPVPVESAPLTISKSVPATTDNFVEEAVVVVHRNHRHWGRRRHRRVRVCHWRGGRRVCRWHWVWR